MKADGPERREWQRESAQESLQDVGCNQRHWPILPAARTSTLPRPERHRGRSGPRRVPLRLSQTLPCARREGSQFPSLFVQYDNVVDAFALRVQAGLRGVHRLAIGRDCNSRRERWLAVYLAYDLERSVVYTLEGVGGIRCLDAATSTAVRLNVQYSGEPDP